MEPRWLNITKAMNYSGLGKNRLKQLAESGDIIGFKDPGDHDKWIFDRKSIDVFRQNQSGNIELKVAKLMGGIV